MRFVALLFALVVGACATMFIIQTGQFAQPTHGASADQAVPATPDAAPPVAAPPVAAPNGAAPSEPATAPQGAAATASATSPAGGQEPAAASAAPAQAPAAPTASAQSPDDVIASIAHNTRAVAASAAKSPGTVAATLTQKPQAGAAAQKPQAASGAAAVPPAVAVRIRPPQGLEGVAFGMSPQQISARYPPAWRRETKDELTLVCNANQQGDQVRFHFTSHGLSQLELQLHPPKGEQLNPFFQRIKQQYAAVYGSLPGSTDERWSDGQTVLQVNYGATEVSVCFTPKT